MRLAEGRPLDPPQLRPLALRGLSPGPGGRPRRWHRGCSGRAVYRRSAPTPARAPDLPLDVTRGSHPFAAQAPSVALRTPGGAVIPLDRPHARDPSGRLRRAAPHQHRRPRPRGAPVAGGDMSRCGSGAGVDHRHSGSGKTTALGRQLAEALAPFVELAGIFHQPGWTELPSGRPRAPVRRRGRRPVGHRRGYSAATTWLGAGRHGGVADAAPLARHRRVLGRTVGRGVRRVELWNGNRERLRKI